MCDAATNKRMQNHVVNIIGRLNMARDLLNIGNRQAALEDMEVCEAEAFRIVEELNGLKVLEYAKA